MIAIGVWLLVNVFIYLQARADYFIIQKDLPINHRTGWQFRAVCLLLIGLPLVFVSIPVYLVYLPLVAVYFWICFDLLLNLLRGLPALYVGKTAFIDWFYRQHFKTHYKIAMLVTKLVLFIVLLTLFIYLYEH